MCFDTISLHRQKCAYTFIRVSFTTSHSCTQRSSVLMDAQSSSHVTHASAIQKLCMYKLPCDIQLAAALCESLLLLCLLVCASVSSKAGNSRQFTQSAWYGEPKDLHYAAVHDSTSLCIFVYWCIYHSVAATATTAISTASISKLRFVLLLLLVLLLYSETMSSRVCSNELPNACR